MAPYLRSHALHERQPRVLRSATKKNNKPATPGVRKQPGRKAKKVISNNQQTPQDQADQPTLLALPPEIRNMIYTLVLQEPERIEVTDDLQIPALLSVCQQTRTECTRLYFASNSFLLHIRQFDASLMLKWLDIIQAMDPTKTARKNTHFKVHACKNFRNLRQWCRWVHAGKDLMRPGMKMGKSSTLASTAIGIADACRGISWSECKKQLERLRKAYDVLEGGWIIKKS